MYRPRQTFLFSVSLLLLMTMTPAARASNSWNGYHWASNKLQPTVKDRTSSPLYDVPAGITEWADLGTPIQPQLSNAKKANIKVSEGYSVFWLGIATITVDGGHITKGDVKLNTKLLESYGSAAADHVFCQELGHILGLDHQNGDSCMSGGATLGLYPAPNAHDIDVLNSVYGHTDDVGGGGGGGGPGGGGGGPGGNGPPGQNKFDFTGDITLMVLPDFSTVTYTHAFAVAQSVPEPSSFLLGAIAIAGLLLSSRARH